jgi:diguanylate cyclase (GGDEF)-like protein
MADDRSNSTRARTQLKPPSWLKQDPAGDMRRLGEALVQRKAEVLTETIAKTVGSGEDLDQPVQASFEQICNSSTEAVGRWIAGDGIEVTVEAGLETSRIFGELAAHRAASLHEVTRRSLWWRNMMAAKLREIASELDVSSDALSEALNMVQLSVEFSLLSMCESFEDERRRTDEELLRREQELAFMATHDPLTGLPNRTLIIDRVTQMLARSTRERTAVAVLFIDIDNFKAINDTLGHAIGDELLCKVAARLEQVVRQVDAVGRLGGDEFVVVADQLSPSISPEMVAERVLDALQPPFQLGTDEGTRLNVTASIGLAVGERISADDLLRDADIAMYRAKRGGKNRYAVFETAMHESLRERMELEVDLRKALSKDEFFLSYQPTLDLVDMRPTGVEALIRWRHPQRGVVQPDEFIPVLEETGLIADVGRWVLREACRQAAAWRQSGYEISVAVNASACQLESDRLVREIAETLSETQLDPAALTIEIAETTLMGNIQETRPRLEAIKELGVRIAIDDFGTGYSSLAHLERLPVDALKIDRSFVSGMARNKEGETLVRTLVQLGKALSLETLAEGIEEEQELSLLKDEHFDGGQGFLFAEPLDAHDTEAFFRRWADNAAAAGVGASPARA